VRIPPEKIDEIRNAADIVDVIGSSVKLRKRGKNFIGLCPFHSEKTPSFNVSQDRQMYHCFGCGVGGNVITFVMEHEKLSFVEAVRALAERLGIALPVTPSDQDAASEQEQLFQVMRLAGKFFYTALTENPEGKAALEYLRKRGFTADTIKTFGLGYSLHSWDALVKHAVENGFTTEQLEKAGLARKRPDGTFYDYFRGRAMFPIFSASGKVIGFGARKLREDDPLAKYINSPETPVYNKSRVLYGLYHAKDAIREEDSAILVEGYADLLAVFQAGVQNVVASSGTALTQEQIQLISRYTKNITIVYDADSAGSKAALRGVDLILASDLDVRVASLPDGDDPDSYVLANGGAAFKTLVGKSVSFIDFITQAYEKQGKLATPEGQAQAVRTIVQSIASMKDELKQNFYIKQVAEKYKLYESTLQRELERQRGDARKRDAAPGYAPPARQAAPAVPPPAPLAPLPPDERNLIYAMLEGGAPVVGEIFRQIQIDDFTHPTARALAGYLQARVERGASLDASALVTEIEDPVQKQLVSELVFTRYQILAQKGEDFRQGDPMKVAEDSLFVLRRNALNRMMKENQLEMKRAIARGEEALPYLERNNQLVTELKELEHRGSAAGAAASS
jgi:DNA primase